MFWLGFAVGIAVGGTVGIFTVAIIRAGGDDPAPPKKRETCRERLAREHPDDVQDKFIGGCFGCPEEYGYVERDTTLCPNIYDDRWVKNLRCAACWDRPVEVDDR